MNSYLQNNYDRTTLLLLTLSQVRDRVNSKNNDWKTESFQKQFRNEVRITTRQPERQYSITNSSISVTTSILHMLQWILSQKYYT